MASQPGSNLMKRDLFDEAHYLRVYPDVAQAVREGRIASGYDHFRQHGQKEGRFGSADEMPEGKGAVAFFFFNRPEWTRLSFERIRDYAPARLLLIADGPRTPEEGRRVEECRAIVERIDWDCEVSRHYSDRNLGCRERISTGLRWVFGQVEAAMILEDDCVAHPDFFEFCHAALHRYRDRPEIMHVSGSTFVIPPNCHASAWFSRHSDIWGWATWRRAFELYDVTMKDWSWRRRLPAGWLGDTQLERNYWRGCFDKIWRGQVDTWDYQWHYALMRRRAFGVVPRVNLITNIGHGPTATHTHACGVDVDLQATEPLGPLMLPPEPVRDPRMDTLLFMRRYALGDLPPIGRTTMAALKALHLNPGT